jgi:hypothetical protein
MDIRYDPKEIEFFEMRHPSRVYISKLTEFKNSVTGEVTSKRTIRKVFEKSEDVQVVNVHGEYVLRSSPAGRDQVRVVVHDNDNSRMSLTIQKFGLYGHRPTQFVNFTFRDDEFAELLEFLRMLRFLDLSKTDNTRHELSTLQNMVLVERDDKELLSALKTLQGQDRLRVLEALKNSALTKEDLDILSGRKDGLETFRRKLFNDTDWDEPAWQKFFEANQWIFGYGLDYRFLKILQREAHVSNVDLDGTNSVVGDFLMGSSDFTVLVELKRPDTPLFGPSKNRSRAWKLSDDLQDAVSQILAQKADWQTKSTQENYDRHGGVITQRTHDPRCMLIVGAQEQFEGTDREKEIKLRTFELFRRDSRNIEILTYTELFERAHFIVNQKPLESRANAPPQDSSGEFDDDIPF